MFLKRFCKRRIWYCFFCFSALFPEFHSFEPSFHFERFYEQIVLGIDAIYRDNTSFTQNIYDSFPLASLDNRSFDRVHSYRDRTGSLHPLHHDANAQQWPRRKTLFVTFLCGIGHVLSSVILGMIGIAFGVALHKLQFIESVRNDSLAWRLIAFGMI